MLDPRDRQEAVAEIRLGRRADADARPRGGQQVELVAVGVSRVHDRGAGRQAALAVEELDRPQAVLGQALVDLARLLVGVDVQRQLVRCGVAAELGERRRRTRAHGVGGDTDADPLAPQRLELARGTRPPTPGGTSASRRAGSRRRGRRTRCRPRQPPRRRPEPRRARGSGTRRPRCSRRCAARGRPRRTRGGSPRRSATRRARSSRRATPRSRRRARSRAAPAGTHGSGRRRIRARRESAARREATSTRISFPGDAVPHSLCAARAAAERAHDRPAGPDPGLRRADPDVRQRPFVGRGARVRGRGRDRPDRRLPGAALARRVRASARSPTRSPTG